jgi:hypothetical protein
MKGTTLAVEEYLHQQSPGRLVSLDGKVTRELGMGERRPEIVGGEQIKKRKP